MTQTCKSESHRKTTARFHLKHNAYAPTYGNFSLSAEQLTSDIASFEHITEAFNNYNFYYYSIPEQPYADCHLGRQQITFPTTVPNPQHGPNASLSITKLPYFNSDLL